MQEKTTEESTQEEASVEEQLQKRKWKSNI